MSSSHSTIIIIMLCSSSSSPTASPRLGQPQSQADIKALSLFGSRIRAYRGAGLLDGIKWLGIVWELNNNSFLGLSSLSSTPAPSHYSVTLLFCYFFTSTLLGGCLDGCWRLMLVVSVLLSKQIINSTLHPFVQRTKHLREWLGRHITSHSYSFNRFLLLGDGNYNSWRAASKWNW